MKFEFFYNPELGFIFFSGTLVTLDYSMPIIKLKPHATFNGALSLIFVNNLLLVTRILT
jgi:hypothetical protein